MVRTYEVRQVMMATNACSNVVMMIDEVGNASHLFGLVITQLIF